MREYSVYKGLQMPLVFKGFRGRYIYWGAASIVLSIVAAGLTSAFFSLLGGVLAMVAVMGGGIYYTSVHQKKGLHDKTKSSGVYVIKPNLNGNRYVKKEESV